jgi:DNA-binding NarL/FixJ family response regulator
MTGTGLATKIRLLIVDDQAHVRRELSKLLGLIEGLEVAGEAANGLEAVRQAEALSPDVVLMDLVMPRLDGIEAARQIKGRGLAQGVVVLTMHADAGARRAAAQAGADAFIEKGTDIPTLIKAIRRAAGQQT